MPAVLLSNVNLLKSPEKFNIGIQDLKYDLSTTSWKKSIPRQTGKQFLIWGPWVCEASARLVRQPGVVQDFQLRN